MTRNSAKILIDILPFLKNNACPKNQNVINYCNNFYYVNTSN